MCTVTFIPAKDTIFLTSNRDEGAVRGPAAKPEQQAFASGKIVFPKDGEAGGTWVAVHENGNAMVLLNGAFEHHHRNPPYRKSRGLIFLEIFDAIAPTDHFNDMSLNGVEPFTLIIWQAGSLWESRWDGHTKYQREMDAEMPHIWSSATLYDAVVRERRENWFTALLATEPEMTSANIRHFHRFGGNGDAGNDLRMNRDGQLLTVSITGISLSSNLTRMHYEDLLTNEQYIQELPLKQIATERT